MSRKLYTPREDKLRILGFSSGSGNSLWKALELQEQLNLTIEGCPYEIVGVFSDNPDSKAIEYAKEIGLPHYSLNLRDFHKHMGRPLSDLEARAAFDAEVYRLIQPCEADMILLAGYVWATTEILVENYLVVNVHPADLSVNRDGGRPYAGGNGVGDTIRAKEATICSSSHIATCDIDGGPLLLLSPDILLDYTLYDNPDDMKKHYLKIVNEHSRNLATRVLLDIAEGKFEYSDEGKLYYRGTAIPFGFKIYSWLEDKPRHEREISALFAPKSVAVIGASNKGGLGYSILHNSNIAGLQGELYAVNRNGETVDGIKAFTTVEEIPGQVDLAILAVPSDGILDIVKSCGEKGVKAVVCITAGFRETGAEGAENEAKLKSVLDQYNMRMLGPNCMGILNTDDSVRLNTTMLQHIPKQGKIAFITQSGAIGAAMLDYSDNLGMGFSIIASLGNQADVNVNDMLPILAEDEQTEVILLYLEAIVEPMRFLRIAKKVIKKKPIILIKAGRSTAGANAATSHTGSIAGSDSSLTAMLDKIGIIRVDTLEQAYFTAMAMSKMPRMKGDRVGVLTNAGGPGILAIDSLSNYGFDMPSMSEAERKALAGRLLKEASTGNPIDVVAAAPASHYSAAAHAMLKSGLYDALLVVCVPPATIDTGLVAKEITEELKGADIPVLCNFIGPTLGQPAREVFNAAGIPCIDYPEKLAEILSFMKSRAVEAEQEAEDYRGGNSRQIARIHEARKRIKDCLMEGKPPSDRKQPANDYLPSDIAYELLEKYGFDVPAYRLIDHNVVIDASNENYADFSYPLVAKIEHSQVVHKSDEGGVILNIANKEQLAETVSKMLKKFPGARGVLAQKQCNSGIELILGGKAEDEMGSFLLVGAGGTGVEIYKDAQLSHVPVSMKQAEKAIFGLQCYPLLRGYRGKPGVNIEKLKETMMRLSRMLIELPEIKEIDLNPVVYEAESDSFKILDCRIKI